MKVIIKKFDVAMEVKNKGVSLDVYAPDGGDRLGDLKLTKTGLTWCRGPTSLKVLPTREPAARLGRLSMRG